MKTQDFPRDLRNDAVKIMLIHKNEGDDIQRWCCCRFDLTLEMTMDAGKNTVAGHIEYRTDLFKRSTVEDLVKHFEVRPLWQAVF